MSVKHHFKLFSFCCEISDFRLQLTVGGFQLLRGLGTTKGPKFTIYSLSLTVVNIFSKGRDQTARIFSFTKLLNNIYNSRNIGNNKRRKGTNQWRMKWRNPVDLLSPPPPPPFCFFISPTPHPPLFTRSIARSVPAKYSVLTWK